MNSVCASPFDAPLSGVSSIRSSIYGLNNAAVASASCVAKGKRWHDPEIKQLLTLVRKKKSINEIALTHQRTKNAILLKLRSLAVDYFHEGRTTEEIQKFTGLSKEDISAAIQKRLAADDAKKVAADAKKVIADSDSGLTTETEVVGSEPDKVVESKPEPKSEPEPDKVSEPVKTSGSEPTMREMMAVLLDLQKGMKVLVPDEPEPTMRDLMKVVADIQKRMAVLLDKVQ